MEIRNLTTFVRIAEVRNFSKVAEELGYSQSAVTMQIKQLEEELNVRVFERIGKRVKLTAAGERLLPYALEILESVNKAEHIAEDPGKIEGKLRIGTSESYVTSVLPDIMTEFNEKYPSVEVTTRVAFVSDLVDMLKRNDIDILNFLDVRLNFPEWVKVCEKPERILFVASSASPLAKEKNITFERLLKEPMYLTEKGVSYRYAMEQLLAEKGYELHPVWEVGNTDVITRILLKGKGVSFLPEYVVRDYIKKGRLVALDTECPEITMYSQLVYHKNKHVTPQMRAFTEVLAEYLKKI